MVTSEPCTETEDIINNPTIVIGAAVGLFIFLILLFLVVYCCRKYRKL